MATSAPAGRVPLVYWIVAGVSLVWNGFGGFDYTMTKLRNMEYLTSALGTEKLATDMLAMLDTMPVWAHFLWGLGVWTSVLGSVLLLVRSRHAVVVFLVSLVAAVLSFAYQATLTFPAELDTPMMKVMPFVIVGALVFLWWYARRARAQGILR